MSARDDYPVLARWSAVVESRNGWTCEQAKALDEIDRLRDERLRLIGVIVDNRRYNARLANKNRHVWSERKRSNVQRNNDDFRAATGDLPPYLVARLLTHLRLIEMHDPETTMPRMTAGERSRWDAAEFVDSQRLRAVSSSPDSQPADLAADSPTSG